MTAGRLRWGVLAGLWLVFTLWYTNLAGPLTAAEAETFVERARDQGQEAAVVERLQRFMATDDGGAFVMANALDFAPVDGRENIGRYMEHMMPALLSRASHPLFAGPTIGETMELTGIDEAQGRAWDQGALVRYRSRRDLLEIAFDPAFEGPHAFKLAGLRKTIAFPVSPVLNLGEPRLLLALVLALLGLIADRISPPPSSARAR